MSREETRLTEIGEIVECFAQSPYYLDRSIFLLKNSVIPAINNGKYLPWFGKGKKLLGVVTYAFLTDEEKENNEFDGDEVFARNSGDNLHFCQFVCNGSKRDVLKFVRFIQKSLSHQYPDIPIATGTRKKNGSSRPELWFRKEVAL